MLDRKFRKGLQLISPRGLAELQRMHWDNLRYFLVVARSGSLSRAGRSLGVDPATLSRRIRQLEREVGTKLFLRQPKGYVRTAAGERLLARAEELEREILACQAALASEEMAAGTVVVTTTEALAGAFVLRHLSAFGAAYPGVSVELIRTEQTLNLSRREADVALRLARPHQLDLRARRVARLDFGLYASPAWIERHGSLREPGDLRSCSLIDWGDARPDFPATRWFAQALDDRVVFRANSPGDRLAAARDGIGVALGPCLMAEEDPGLVRLLPDLELAGPEVWLLVHRELAGLARVRAVLDFLAQRARSDSARFAGRSRLS
jgi:DNA-binding transcriptional LysR family regulator